MSRPFFILACLIACGDDPHVAFVTPLGAYDVGAARDSEGPLDNLVLNPNFTLAFSFINGVGVSTFDWDLIHDIDTPTGQPAIEGRSTTSLLFRMVRSPMRAEVWVSGDPADASSTEVVATFTDVDTLEDFQVGLIPIEERVVGSRRWTLYAGEVPAGDGHGMLVVSPDGEEVPQISGPVVRAVEVEDGLRSAWPTSRPADERWRALYPAHRPDFLTKSPGGSGPTRR